VRKLILLLVLVLVAAPAVAQPMPDLKLSGLHYQFNIIGHPKGISGDDSSGRSIMIPLKNAGVNGNPSIVCEADPYVAFDPTENPEFTSLAPVGAKIYFQASDHFEILDRDATDGSATVLVPVDSNQTITFDIYLRVLGKPSTCMDLDAYAYDGVQQLYFLAGSIDLNRKTGRSTWVKANYLFDVLWCQVLEGVCSGDVLDLSVFDSRFSEYFWNILNDGTRLVQVRLYPRK
jgi:hypothetical protein